MHDIIMRKERPNITEAPAKRLAPQTGWLTAAAVKFKPGQQPFKPRALFARARMRVGGEALLGRLKWLVAFAQADRKRIRAHLTAGGEPILAYEIAYLTGSSPYKVTARAAISAADILLAGMRSLSQSGRWDVQLPPGVVCMLESDPAKDNRGVWLTRLHASYVASDPGAALIVLAVEVLQAEGARLRVCASRGCDRLFVRLGRKLFCSELCSDREQVRRWRKRNPEVYKHSKMRKYVKGRVGIPP